MAYTFEPVEPSNCKELSILTKRSKSHWGYSKEQLAEWDEELTITPEYLSQHQGIKLMQHKELVAYYTWRKELDALYLDNLFVAPEHIGKGHGKRLMQHLKTFAQKSGFDVVQLESDPNAQSFYSRLGFHVTGQTPSSIPGRYLIQMELSLK